MRKTRILFCLLILASVAVAAPAQSPLEIAQALPAAPEPRPFTPVLPPSGPCDVRNAAATIAATAAVRTSEVEENDGNEFTATPRIVGVTLCVSHLPMIMPMINWYARFLNGPQVKPLTPPQKAHLAVRNLVDPFNLITIAGEAGIAVAADSHSPYGPGFKGYGRYVGTSFTEDMEGEFFGTFLIPSLTREDPHYHRMPGAGINRRIFHALAQIVWTEDDKGKGMLNYSNLVGFAIESEINNLYVPGLQTDVPATATRYGIALAIAPSDNLITEFIPDIASHIHVRVVLVQRIINQVARSEEAAGSSP